MHLVVVQIFLQEKYYIEADDNTREDWLRDAIHDFVYDKWVKGENQKVDYDIDGIERTD